MLPEYRAEPSIAPDVPEADALDQAMDAGYDDDLEVDEVGEVDPG